MYNMDPHIKEWKSIRDRFSKINTPEYKFRVECIDNLIISAEDKAVEIAHFR